MLINPTIAEGGRPVVPTSMVSVGVRRCEERCYPIFIPSKGRYLSKRGTIAVLIQDQIPFTAVVQQEEAALYEKLIDRLVAKWWGHDGTLDEHPSQDEQYRRKYKSVVTLDMDITAMADTLEIDALTSSNMTVEERSSSSSRHLSPLPPLAPPPRTAFEVRQLFKVESLPLSDQGVSYVRNYILRKLVPAAFAPPPPPATSPSACDPSSSLTDSYSHSSDSVGMVAPPGERWYWVMDDDIQRFYLAHGGKNHPITPRRLFTEVYTRLEQLHHSVDDVQKIVILSLDYARFAYTYGDCDLALNSYNNIATLFHYDFIPEECTYRFHIREDYDFTLQLISHGLQTARFRNLSFDVPGMAELSGGMTEYYKTQKEDIREQNRMFIKTWPAVAHECIKGKGAFKREDIRVRWDLLHPKKNSNPGATLRSRIPFQIKVKTTRCDYHSTPIAEMRLTEFYRERIEPSTRPLVERKMPKLSSPAQKLEERQRNKQRREYVFVNTSKRQTHEGRKREETHEPKAPPGWKGYALQYWRYLSPVEAPLLHLRLIPPDRLQMGQTVAVVPPLFEHRPSVVEATLIDKSFVRRRRKTGGGEQNLCLNEAELSAETYVECTVVARGLPLLTVRHCYEIPEVGVSVAAAAVDAFFETEQKRRGMEQDANGEWGGEKVEDEIDSL